MLVRLQHQVQEVLRPARTTLTTPPQPATTHQITIYGCRTMPHPSRTPGSPSTPSQTGDVTGPDSGPNDLLNINGIAFAPRRVYRRDLEAYLGPGLYRFW